MSETTITHSDEDGLTYVTPPEFEYEVGDRFFVGDAIKLSTGKEAVLYYEIDSRSREYIIEERTWYVNYKVTFYDPIEQEIDSMSLFDTEITEDGFEKTTMSAADMADEARYEIPA